jgi:hypothetical protein
MKVQSKCNQLHDGFDSSRMHQTSHITRNGMQSIGALQLILLVNLVLSSRSDERVIRTIKTLLETNAVV